MQEKEICDILNYGDNMKDIKRGLIVNLLIIIICVVLFRSVSYSLDTNPETSNKDLLIQTGNMQVVLNIPNDKYELLDSFEESISDTEGVKQDGFNFSIKNTGNIPIEYYEIRMVDQENKISTLPHKYIRFTISYNNKEYEDIKSLGAVDSILYSGYDLNIGESSTFNLKMWVSEDVDVLGKTLYGAIEVTLYQKYDVYKNYVLYDSADSSNVPVRTSIYSPITSTIPKRDGYTFVGWETKDHEIKYYPGETYKENTGVTLYAIWEKE